MKYLLPMIILIFLVSCTPYNNVVDKDDNSVVNSRCGDGICQKDENDISCTKDCTVKNDDSTEDISSCATDEECIPKPECHPMECINIEFKDRFKNDGPCTEIFMSDAAYSLKDCRCVGGRCTNMNKNS